MSGPRVIAFANQKGGVGKTTTAVNTAACLADIGHRMLIVDLDPQANATSGLGAAKRKGGSVYRVLLGDGVISDNIVHTGIERLHLIPSEPDLAGVEVDIARSERYLHCLKAALHPIRVAGEYDYVFVDCPPSLGILTSNALTAADGLVVPVQCEYLAMEGLSMITRLAGQLRAAGANPGLEINGIVMTMFDGRTKLSSLVAEDVRNHFGATVYQTVIPRSIRLSEAPSFGRPITLHDSRSSGAIAYRALSQEFLDRERAARERREAPPSGTRKPRETASGRMTSKERLRRAFFHEVMDAPGVCCRASFPGGDPTYAPLIEYLEECSDLKRVWNARSCVSGPPVVNEVEPHSVDFERHVETLVTPIRELRAARLVSLKGEPGTHESFMIGSRADAEAYLSSPMPAIGGAVDSFFEAEQALDERGIVAVCIGTNPGGRAAALMGTENFALFSVSARDVVEALCEREMRILLELVKFLVERGVGPFFSLSCEELTASPLRGPSDFRDFIVRYDKPIVDLIHEAGGRMRVHCRCRVKSFLQDFVDMGVDVLHPVEPPPLGDITAAEAKTLARGRLCLESNIRIGNMHGHSPEAIKRETELLIADAFDDRRGLIISPTDSPLIRGEGHECMARYKAMVETVRNYRYSAFSGA